MRSPGTGTWLPNLPCQLSCHTANCMTWLGREWWGYELAAPPRTFKPWGNSNTVSWTSLSFPLSEMGQESYFLWGYYKDQSLSWNPVRLICSKCQVMSSLPVFLGTSQFPPDGGGVWSHGTKELAQCGVVAHLAHHSENCLAYRSKLACPHAWGGSVQLPFSLFLLESKRWRRNHVSHPENL